MAAAFAALSACGGGAAPIDSSDGGAAPALSAGAKLGKRIFEEVSKEGWQQWLKDSVKFINTYRLDLTSAEGQKFMFDQCEIYFGWKEGDAAQTAFVPEAEKK